MADGESAGAQFPVADAPVDRHVFAKRIRLWAVADGFISTLDADNLIHFEPGPPARWRFLVSAGDFQAVEVEVEVVHWLAGSAQLTS